MLRNEYKIKDIGMKRSWSIAQKLLGLVLLVTAMLWPVTTHAASAVTITSPTANQQTSKDVVVKGTATPNASVKVAFDGILIGIINADTSGDWQYSLFNVSAGNHTFEAEVSEAGKVYFATTPSDSPSALNSYDVDSGAVNDAANFPVNDGSNNFVNGPVSPDGKTLYLSGYVYTGGYLAKVDIASGTTSPVSGLPGGAYISLGAFSPDGSKYFAPDVNGGSGNVYVVDVASNAVIDTIHLNGTDVINYATQFNDKIYASDFTNGHIYIIDPSDDSFTDFDPGCAASSVFPGKDTSYFWVGCQGGNILKLDTSSHSTLQTISTPIGGALSISEPKGSNKLYASNGFGGSTVYVYDTDTGNLLNTINTPSDVSITTASNDGSKIFAPMGSGATQMMIIHTVNDNASLVNTGGAALAALQAPDSVATAAVEFSVASDSGNNKASGTDGSSTSSTQHKSALADTGNATLKTALAAVLLLVGLVGSTALAYRQKYQLYR